MIMRLSPVPLRVLPVLALLAMAGARAEECALNTNPVCAAAVNLGTLAGDTGNAVITRTGTGEANFYVRIEEASSASRALTARIQLQSPPEADYDLYLRCANCAAAALPYTKGGPGGSDAAAVTRADTWADNSFTLYVEVRHRSGKSCAPWTLTINGNTAPVTGALSCG